MERDFFVFMAKRSNIFRPLSFVPQGALYFLLFTFYFSLPSCTFNPPLQGKGIEALHGEWQQDTSALQKKLVNYTLYHYKFDCDSFFVQIKTFSKVNYGDDTCMRSGHWAEYAKGAYVLRHDTLRLQGLFCTANYQYKNEGGCFRSGYYDEHFIILKKTDSVYQFTNTSSVTPFTVHLETRNTCNPKAL